MVSHRIEHETRLQSQSHSNTNVRPVRPKPATSVHHSFDEDHSQSIAAIVVYLTANEN